MTRHDTPVDVALILARHAPRQVFTLLDPAVGTGVLVRPFIERFGQSVKSVLCFDTDPSMVRYVSRIFRPILDERLHVLNTNFLEWGSTANEAQEFDCIVMNPPFAARQQTVVKLDHSRDFPGVGNPQRYVPIEVAFVVKAILSLAAAGRLLAIVPSSVTCGLKTEWLRRFLFEHGSVEYVHELPRNTFKSADARVYLFVFQKSKKQGALTLCDTNLRQPRRIVVKSKLVESALRLDYGFHVANSWYLRLRDHYADLNWQPVSNLLSVQRGSVDSPVGRRRVLHTVDCVHCFWEPTGTSAMRNSPECARPGDLLMKRVARRCTVSIGPFVGRDLQRCSDCLLIMRPKRPDQLVRILFGLRVVLAWETGAPLVERGTGATYVAEESLRQICLPVDLAIRFPRSYANYRLAVSRRDSELMKAIEKHTRKLMHLRLHSSILAANRKENPN